jgi:hypothetical protein
MTKLTSVAISLLALLLPLASFAQTTQQAETFVHNIYKQYDISDATQAPDFTRSKAPSVFSPSLIQLLRRDQRNTPAGYEGKLGADPICDCQDFQNLKITALNITKDTELSANASLTVEVFANDPSSTKTIRLHLTWTSHHWRIDDIETKKTPSLRKLLR